jgi:hypothetical protein
MAIVINSTTGEIDLDATTPSTYVVTYTVGGVSSTQEVTVNALDNAGFSYSASSYTQADADPTPTITGLTGGTFSAGSGLVFVDSGTNTGSSTGEIDLSASTIASHTITYSTSSSGSSVCPNTSTFSLAVTAAYSPFQMQFEVTSGVSKTITIPDTVGTSFTVDWGDGATTTETGGTISHTYNDGTNTDVTNPVVSIGAAGDTGPFTTFKFNNGGSKDDLLDVPQWGSIVFTTLAQMFQGCQNTSFQISATDAPTIIGTGTSRTMSYMFFNADYFNSDISHWDISNITGSGSSVRDMFHSADNFNQNLSSWNIQTTSAYAMLASNGMSTENFTDTIVGWAVTVYKNSGLYNVGLQANYGRTFDCSRTSDNASGQTYAVKYGSDWTATGWTDAGDALDYLTGATANWTISNYTPQNC